MKLYYNFYDSRWKDPDLNNGYFDPRSLLSHTLGVYTGIDITNKLFVEAKASGGYEFQRWLIVLIRLSTTLHFIRR